MAQEIFSGAITVVSASYSGDTGATFSTDRGRAGIFGPYRDLLVSTQHRAPVRDSLAELLYGENETLIAAKDLRNDRSVTRRTGDTVTYVHIMFDRHQVVYAECLPGPQTTNLFKQPVITGICRVFPKLDPVTGQGYSGTARRTLHNFEAQLLLSGAQAT